MKLEPEQAEAVELIATKNIGVVTGGPGTGKTSCLKEAIRLMTERKQDFTLLAPTGRAARRMSEVTGCPASTIHRMIRAQSGGDLAPTKQLFEADGMFSSDAYIVDEASMLDVELCAHLMTHAGKRRLVFIGDVNQLPSISPGRVLADLIDSGAVPVVRLTTVHRAAATSWVHSNAPKILLGKNLDLKTGPGFEFVDVHNDEDVKHEIQKQVVALRSENRDHVVLTPMRKTPLGTYGLNSYLQTLRIEGLEAATNKPQMSFDLQGASYYIGDPVRHTKNNYELDVFNGEIGVVMKIFPDAGIEVAYGGRTVFYNHAVAQDELVLSYATTIHSSQGGEYDTVIVVVHDRHKTMLDRSLFYTAVTRAKRRVVLVGTKSAIDHAIRNVENQQRITTLRERLIA